MARQKVCEQGRDDAWKQRSLKAKVNNCPDSILLQPCNGWKVWRPAGEVDPSLKHEQILCWLWHCNDLNTLHKIWLTTKISIKQQDVTKQVNEVEDFPELVINCHQCISLAWPPHQMSHIAMVSHLTFLRLNGITVKRRSLKIRKDYWWVCSTTWI